MIMNIRIDEEFKRKLGHLQRINGYRTKSDTIRKIIEKEWRKETEDNILDSVPERVNITGIDGRSYVEILNAYEFKDYWRYDLNILDSHGDAISIYIPKNEPRSVHKEST